MHLLVPGAQAHDILLDLPAPKDAVGEDIRQLLKPVSDVVSPVTGMVEEANSELEDEPQKLNEDPYGAWIAKIKDISSPG